MKTEMIKTKIQLLSKRYKNYFEKDSIKILLVFLFLFSSFSFSYFLTDKVISLDDPFFHIRFAEIIKEKGWQAFTDFNWLYFSKISQEKAYFVYYNFLFYLILLPFTWIKPLFLALKLYGVIFASLAFSSLYYFFLKLRTKKAFLLTVFLMTIFNFSLIWRFLPARPYTLAPALLILELYFLYKRNYKAVFLLCFLYPFWHSVTFFFPLMVAATYFIFENFYYLRFDWKILKWSISGIILSLFVILFFTPGFFVFLKDVMAGIYVDTVLGHKINIAEGGETYPQDFFIFIQSNKFLVLILSVLIIFEVLRYWRMKKYKDNDELIDKEQQPLIGSLFFLTVLFLLGTFLSKRNGDFFVFFGAAYIGLSFNFLIHYFEIRNLSLKRAIERGLIITIFYLYSANILLISHQISLAGDFRTIEEAANWLKNNVQKDEVVFNTSWNWFPLLFYYNPNNYYIVGIEPRFLYDYNPELYWNWWNVSTQGYLCSQEKCEKTIQQKKYYWRSEDKKKEWFEQQGDLTANYLLNNFKSHYVITSIAYKDFNELMDNSSRFQKVFEDKIYNTYLIYKINN